METESNAHGMYSNIEVAKGKWSHLMRYREQKDKDDIKSVKWHTGY